MSENDPVGGARIEIALSRRFLALRLLWLVPLFLLLFAGGGYALYRWLLGDPGDGLQVSAIWIAAGVIMLVVALDALRVLTLRGPAVIIDETGVLDRRYMRRVLPWTAIRRAEIRTQDDKPIMVGFWSTDAPRRYRRPLPLFNYFGIVHLLEILAKPFRFPPLPIDLQPLAAPPERVIDAVRRYWGEPERRAMPTPARRDA